jgi:hypothetical protein
MKGAAPQKFDFDEWMRLARCDPAEFERRRRVAIESAISHASARSQHKLRGLQWRIDMERQRARSPMAACIRISSMMWESVAGQGGLLEVLEALRTGDARRPRSVRREADILTFKPR